MKSIQSPQRGGRRLGAIVAFVTAWSLIGGCTYAQQARRVSTHFLADESIDAEKQLQSAASHVRDQQWPEAIQIYQRIIDKYGDKVARLPRDDPGADAAGEFVLFVDDRRFCHRSLARLPAEARAIYRNRIDSLAGPWFREGANRRDVGLLRRVVNQAFCSSFGDDALELLGDLAFQNGRFGEALGMYRRLVADDPADPFALVHPDPSVDLVRVAAKKLLCRAAGDDPPSPAELAEFTQRHPAAEGSLAGRDGNYAQILALALADDHLALPAQPDDRWPTFAGSLRRTKVAPGPIDVGSTQWRVDLAKIIPNRTGSPRAEIIMGTTSTPAERLLTYHPIVLGDQVIVTDGTRVIAYNLSDRPAEGDGSLMRGVEPAWKYDPESHGPGPTAQRPHTGIPRYTLTAVGHRIYARLGATSPSFFPGWNGVGAGVSSIVALDWDTQGKLLWEQQATKLALPDRPPDRNNFRTLSFEGTPVADSENVYVAVTDRREQTALYVACFDADTGTSRWVRYLGAAPPAGQNLWNGGMPMPIGMTAPGDFNHRLLTLDGATLYYQTDLGALVALEAESGSLLWVATYPRHDADQGGATSDRDLNPAVVHGGRVFVAPSDADSIFAFDAASGRNLWKSSFKANDVKLTHLLGVAKGRLVATGNCVLLLNVKTGELVHTWPDSGKLEGFGRGLLAGDFIYWPTQNEIQVLDQRSGLRTEAPIKLLENYHTRGGNLAAGDGYLIVAQADGMVVFCQNSRLIERYQDEIAKTPDYAPNYFRLARAAEAIGKDQLALAKYAEASRRARPQEMIDGLPLAASARDHHFGLLIRLANQGRRAKKYDQAIVQLEEAAKVARSDPDRLQAQMLLADVLLDARRPGDAVAICERLLNDERLRPLAVAATDGRRTLRADLLIADRLKTIVRDNGRAVYASYDRQAKTLFERGKAEQDARLLDELCRIYPVATVVPLALLELGAIYESKGKFADAAHAYKRMLAMAASDETRALALWQLAHVYDERKLFVAARDSYLDLQARFPGVRLPGKDGELTAGERVAAELARAPYAGLVADRPRPPTGVPMVRRWHLQVPLGQVGRVLSAEGVAPSLEVGKLLLVDKNGLRTLDPTTGLARWSAELGESAAWAGFLADKLIVASPHQIVALELSQGAIQWRYDLAKPSKNGGQPDPFAAAKPADAAGPAERGSDILSGFQLVKGRVFCQRGRHELLALDGDTGAVDWSFSSPIGEINPHIWIGPDRAVFQVLKPNELVVLQTDDGKPVTRVSQGEKEVLERPPFPIDEESVLLVSDRRTVKKVELVHGQTNWEYRESEELPVNGPPRLLGDAERLLVLHDGRTLIRLDAATGSKRWACLLGIDDLSDRPGSVACDEKRAYFVNQRNVHVLSLDDGKPLWSRYLEGPESAVWSLALSSQYVMAFPNKTGVPESDVIENMPLVVRRREDGELVQRFVFQTVIADATIKLDWRGALVATSRGIWGLASKGAGPSAAFDRPR
jgi:cellulose synthase operon protein C